MKRNRLQRGKSIKTGKWVYGFYTQSFSNNGKRHNIIEVFGNEYSGKNFTVCHNIDPESMILRKGATSAKKDELVLVPMNMRDGMLVAVGQGNPDWNFSAPHGAGRLYSRRKAKETFKLEDYEKSMDGIFSTCISKDTIDEAPFVYKDWQEIQELMRPTAQVIKHLKPVYNFKASD